VPQTKRGAAASQDEISRKMMEGIRVLDGMALRARGWRNAYRFSAKIEVKKRGRCEGLAWCARLHDCGTLIPKTVWSRGTRSAWKQFHRKQRFGTWRARRAWAWERFRGY